MSRRPPAWPPDPALARRRREARRRMYRRRRITVAVTAAVVFSGMGFGVAQLLPSGGGTNSLMAAGAPSRARSGRAGSTTVITDQAAANTTTSTVPPPPAEPGGGRRLFPSHRIVALYGSPRDPELGVLGDGSPTRMWGPLQTAARPYAAPGRRLVLAYELVAYTAYAAPGPSGDYTARLSDAEIDAYQRVVQAHGGMLILDIQPGRSDVLSGVKSLAKWLALPDVALALDPEWEVAAGEEPGQVLGHTTATEINAVGAWLDQLSAARDLPQKLLLVHQWTQDMVIDKGAVRRQPHLAIVFNMDGYGGPEGKLSVYRMLARDPRWPLGYKLFYQRDQPLQTPAEVLALHPAPDIIEYE
ncbi:MAG TPA: hypothetical protein VKV06_16430 [Acidimicrobiales bacterium]|nr:hypothetical protein [Acidimicrobiales bacterium]